MNHRPAEFQNDYRYMLDVLANRRPARLPLYEHIINPPIMEKILNVSFAGLLNGNPTDERAYFTQYCRFFKEMTYDTVSFEVCITEILPDKGAIYGAPAGSDPEPGRFRALPVG